MNGAGKSERPAPTAPCGDLRNNGSGIGDAPVDPGSDRKHAKSRCGDGTFPGRRESKSSLFSSKTASYLKLPPVVMFLFE